MFRKLVTNLPYSPGLLNQVGFYAKRLKQEEFVRRLGMIFAILALLVNINLSIFSPQASVLASPGNDVVTGGIVGDSVVNIQQHAINAMKGSAYTAAIFDYYGITEQDIRNTSLQTISTADESLRSVGRQAFGRGAESCKLHNGYSFCERSMYAAYNYRALNVRALMGLRADRVGQSDPWFALIESCGNVVVRVGKDESISLSKTLSPQQNQLVKAGDTIDFRIKIKSNNENGALFPRIKDTLPAHTEYVSHSPKDMFDKVNINGREVELLGTRPLYGLGPFEERIITITTRVLASAPEGARLCNKASAVSLSDSTISNTEPCVSVEIPKPAPVCLSLRMLGAGGTNTVRTFEAQAQPDRAVISGYNFDFGDSTSKTISTANAKATTTHTYQPGTYTAKVVVNTDVGNITNAQSCVIQLTIDHPSPNPSVTCDYIKVVSGLSTERERGFEASATAENGAVINSFHITYGDGTSEDVASNSTNKIKSTHIYEGTGNYDVTLTANSSLGAITNTTSCLSSVVIEEPPALCPYNANLLLTDADCVKPTPNPVPEPLPTPVPDPVPELCQYNPKLLASDIECGQSHIIKLKTVENVTQAIENANNTVAHAGDTLRFTLSTENNGTATSLAYIIRDDLADVLQYATIIDTDGGIKSDNGLVLTWPKIDIKANQTIIKTITVKIISPIPNTPVSASDPTSFDLTLENAYGNNVAVTLPASLPKKVEGIVTTLPNTGAGWNSLVSTLFIGVVAYFYFRNRLVSKELALIKNDFSGGMAK